MALDNVTFTAHRGQFMALMGPSGSGKSTLLHLIAAMDKPTAGEMTVLGENPHRLPERRLARWRNAHVGFIFQAFNLIPVLTALENVELPLKLTRSQRASGASTPSPHCRWWAWKTECTMFRGSSPAARSSALPSPGRS